MMVKTSKGKISRNKPREYLLVTRLVYPLFFFIYRESCQIYKLQTIQEKSKLYKN